jgi:hypothetical protein
VWDQCVARAFISPFLDKPSASYLLGWIFREYRRAPWGLLVAISPQTRGGAWMSRLPRPSSGSEAAANTRRRPPPPCPRTTGFISSFVIRLNPFWRVSVVGPRPEEPSGSLIVCNHLSNADAYFLSAALLPWETKYIAKASLFDVSACRPTCCPCRHRPCLDANGGLRACTALP